MSQVTGDAHVYRFFIDGDGGAGARVVLGASDADHARVLRADDSSVRVEAVDGAGVVWSAELDASAGVLVLGAPIEVTREHPIIVYAGVRVGGRYDELVDGAVQAGATVVVPVVGPARDAGRIDQRHDRVQRIAIAAAKQAKRASVPLVLPALRFEALVDELPGIVVDPDAPHGLDDVVRSGEPGAPVRLLIGAADGFPRDLVAQLESAGWRRGRLGPTILRAELAAAVAVAIAAMHAPTAPPAGG